MQESKKNSEKRECLSILLITEKNELHTTGIVKLLKRGRQPVPSALESIAERAEQVNYTYTHHLENHRPVVSLLNLA